MGGSQTENAENKANSNPRGERFREREAHCENEEATKKAKSRKERH